MASSLNKKEHRGQEVPSDMQSGDLPMVFAIPGPRSGGWDTALFSSHQHTGSSPGNQGGVTYLSKPSGLLLGCKQCPIEGGILGSLKIPLLGGGGTLKLYFLELGKTMKNRPVG